MTLDYRDPAHRRVRKAVFPVAGLGTRFLPATKAIPKEMLTLVDRPLIHYALDEARAAGIEQFIFVTAEGKGAIEDHFDRAPLLEASLRQKGKTAALEMLDAMRLPHGAVASVRQPEALGLGHAVWCARHLIGNEPFAVLLPDDVIVGPRSCLEQMIEAHAETGGNMVATMTVPRSRISAYGCLDATAGKGPLARASGIVEKPAADVAPSNLAVVGRYILQPSVLDYLGWIAPGAGGEIQLTDALAADIDAAGLTGFRFDGARFDCGSPEGYLEATIALALEREEFSQRFRAMLERKLADIALPI